jgi:hypothetical protein
MAGRARSFVHLKSTAGLSNKMLTSAKKDHPPVGPVFERAPRVDDAQEINQHTRQIVQMARINGDDMNSIFGSSAVMQFCPFKCGS